MIAFREDFKKNKNKLSIDKFQELLDIIYDKKKFHNGSFHESVDLSEIINIIYKVLYEEDNKSIQLIIDKNQNNSMNLTIDLINPND